MARLPVAQRRAQLVTAAVAVARAEGLEAATTRAIAAEAGVALAVVHYCFETKEELLRAVYESLLADLHERALRLGTARSLSVLDELVEGVMRSLLVADADPPSLVLLHELGQHALRRPALADVVAERRALAHRAFTSFAARLAENRGLEWSDPVDVVGDGLLVLHDGVTEAWLVERDLQRARARVRRGAQDLLRRAAAR